ncbi:MAG: hypothetical protein EOO48_09280 [Flavobacterium sp.]|nr:MAG: hypothetical protein EOO48_09280 [Flavobacterium sp.]
MSTTSPKRDDNQELDLSSVTQGVRNMFGQFNAFIYNCIRFVIKNIVLLCILLVIGGGLGAYLDRTEKRIYRHQIIVEPNFNSTDYLYSKIALLESRIDRNDTVFLKKIGFTNPNDLIDVKIAPILDIFKFVTNSGNEINYKLVELMAQDGDIKKVVTDNMTSKNYPYHTITFVTRGKTTQAETVAPLLKYLNDSQYYREIQKQYVKNVYMRLAANDRIIEQIDGVLKGLNSASGDASKGVYINENSQLNDVIKTKQAIVAEQGSQRLDLVGLDKIIKDNSVIINIRDEGSLVGKFKIVLPLVLITLFLIGYFFVSFYKKQSLKYNTK